MSNSNAVRTRRKKGEVKVEMAYCLDGVKGRSVKGRKAIAVVIRVAAAAGNAE